MAPPMVKKYGPLVGMLYVQVAYSAMFLLTRFALTHGMSHYAFVLYRQLFAAVATFPAAYYLNSSMKLNAFSWKSVKQIFFLALFGTSISQNFYYAGLALTSSTFASTMNNLQPAITFLLAYLLKLEEVKIRSWEGQAKVLGTLVCVGGAVVMTLSKVHSDQGLHEVLKQLVVHGEESGPAFIFGAILTVIGSSSWALFVIYQAWIVEEYPSQLTLSALVSLMGSLQVIVIAFIFENPRALILHLDLQLLTVCYGGIFCSGLGVFTIMWCVKEKGPVYSTAFNPIGTLFVAILEPLLLHGQFTWSSLTGMVMVIGGLYLYLWGKAQDGKPCNIVTQPSYGISRGECNTNEIIISEEELDNQKPLLAKDNI